MRKILITIALGLLLIAIGLYGYSYINSKNVNINAKETNLIDSIIPEKVKSQEPITFTIGGDAMLGRAVAWKFDNNITSAFENLGENFFGSVDLGIINLEGPIDRENIKPDPTPNILVFNFPFNSIAALKYLGLNAVSLGNNHSQNQGQTGLDETRVLLEEAEIIPIGSQTKFNDSSIARFGKDSKKLTVLTINLLETEADLTQTIKDEKSAGNFVLVFPHWGGEYQEEKHSTQQETLGHEWIDAGADLVIGSHPHVVQDAEIYNNKPIFYSMGNFVFDQTFSIPTQRGLILKGEISDDHTKIKILPTSIKNYRVELTEGEEKDIVLSKFKGYLGEDIFTDDTLEINKE